MSSKIKWVFAIVMVLSVVIVAQATAINNYYMPAVYFEPTITPTPTPTQKPPSGCNIQNLLGTKVKVCFADIEPKPTTSPLDEWVKIKNIGNNDTNLEGWRMSSDTGNKFDFPPLEFKIGQTVTIWTKSGSNSSSTLYMNRTAEFWKDNKDCGYLKDDSRNTKDSFCYSLAGLFAPSGK